MINLEPRHFEIVQSILSSLVGVKVYAFGSRVTGKNQKFSDLDLCYEGQLDRKLELEIKSAFRESRLPFKVDFVAVDDLPGDYVDSVRLEMIPIS